MGASARVVAAASRPSSVRAWALAGIAVAGTADVAQFVAANTGMFQTAPGRAGGSVLGLAIWTGLTGCAVAVVRGGESARLRRATVALASLAAVGGVGLTAVHAAAHVGGLRPALTGLLGLGALGLAAAGRGR